MKASSNCKDIFIQSYVYDEIDPITKLARHMQNIVEEKVSFMPRLIVRSAILFRIDFATNNWLDIEGLNGNYF